MILKRKIPIPILNLSCKILFKRKRSRFQMKSILSLNKIKMNLKVKIPLKKRTRLQVIQILKKKLRRKLNNFKSMVLNLVKTERNVKKGKKLQNLPKNLRKKFGKNRKKLSKKWLKILWTSSQKSWSKVLLKNKKKMLRTWKLMKTQIRFKKISLNKLNPQLFIPMLNAMAAELLQLLVQDTSVAFAKTLIIVKTVSRINPTLTPFWKSRTLIKFQKLCSLSLMRACQTP